MRFSWGDLTLSEQKPSDQLPAARRGFPQLITVATGQPAILARFPAWPEAALDETDLNLLRQTTIGDNPPGTERLLQAGLLHRADGTLSPTLPSYERARPARYQAELANLSNSVAPRLVPFVEEIRREWESVDEAVPGWEQVAHNLVIGFWLGACGGQLLLGLSQASVAALLVGDPGAMRGSWFGLLRLRPDLALVDTLGAAYPASDLLASLLRQRSVVETLASADQRGQLIIYGDEALKLLRQLSAYRQTSPGPWLPNDYWLDWPVLTVGLIDRVRPSIMLATRGLKLALQDLLKLVHDLDWPGQLRASDLALLALIDLIGLLQTAWAAEGVLPPVVTPWLDDWQLPDAGANLQSEMLKGLGR